MTTLGASPGLGTEPLEHCSHGHAAPEFIQHMNREKGKHELSNPQLDDTLLSVHCLLNRDIWHFISPPPNSPDPKAPLPTLRPMPRRHDSKKQRAKSFDAGLPPPRCCRAPIQASKAARISPPSFFPLSRLAVGMLHRQLIHFPRLPFLSLMD